MTKIKICGLTRKEDAEKAEALGADLLGFVFFQGSPRHISAEKAHEIISGLSGRALKTGLFLDQPLDEVRNIVTDIGLDVVQLHGSEDPSYAAELKKSAQVIKTFRIQKGFDFACMERYTDADFFLFDTYRKGMAGGTGIAFDWGMLEGRSFDKPIFLAGGLNPSNVSEAVRRVRPYAVDVASGVESSPGKKDHKVLKEFIDAAR